MNLGLHIEATLHILGSKRWGQMFPAHSFIHSFFYLVLSAPMCIRTARSGLRVKEEH